MDTEKTYTLADLKEKTFPGTPLAVVGYPIKHSVSPVMHNAAIAKLHEVSSRFLDWAYYRFEIAPEDFAEALPLFHKANFLGLNLTIPHKVQAMDLITGVSADGERMGAVNTLVWSEMGYSGYNTDGYGMKKGLEVDLKVSLEGATVILLGSGGAARAAAVQCLLENCSQLYIGNRSPERLKDLTEVLSEMSDLDRVTTFALAEPPTNLPEAGVLINATSLGLKSDDSAPFDSASLPAGWKVYDMIYNPSVTRLMAEADASGHASANGLSMLVHQGARALEIWSKCTVDDHAMLVAASHALNLPPRYA